MSETTASMAHPSAVVPPSPRRWLKWLLIGSLAVNALLIGVVLRSVWQLRTNALITGPGLEAGLPNFVNSLPAERRDALRRDNWRALRPLRIEARRARSEAARLLGSEPFDSTAFAAAQNAVLEADIKWRRTLQQLLLDVGQRMTPAERRAYLAWRIRWQSRTNPVIPPQPGERQPGTTDKRPPNGQTQH